MKAEALPPSPQTTLVVLLGATEWPYMPEFEQSKAFANSAGDLRRYFLETFVLPKENLLDLFNSYQSPSEIDKEITHFLGRHMLGGREPKRRPRDLLVYFIGHGGFSGSDSSYYLAIRSTRTENPMTSSIPIGSLAHTLKEQARFLRRILILDCCFAASAFRYFQQMEPAQVAIINTNTAFETHDKGIGFPGRGTSLLCSSRPHAPSRLSPDDASTMFTEALLNALHIGDPHQRGNVSLRALARLIDDILNHTYRDQAPRPEVHSPDQSEGDVANVPFFPNLAKERAEISQESGMSLAPIHTFAPRQTRNPARPILSFISRREFVIGIVAGAFVTSSSGMIWWLQSRAGNLNNTATLPRIPPTPGNTILTYHGHVGPVYSVAWSPDGKRIASAGAESEVHVWDTLTGRTLLLFHGHESSVRSLAWSSDGKYIASGGDDKTVQIWDPSGDGVVSIITFRGHTNSVSSVAWSLDANRVLSGSDDKTARIWNIDNTNGPVYHGHGGVIRSVAWSPDNTRVASGGDDKTVQIWEAATGNRIFTFAPVGNGPIPALAWSPDGTRIASATDLQFEKPVEVWNASGGSIMMYYTGHLDYVRAVAWSPNSKRVASGGYDQTVQVWDADTGDNLLLYHGHTGASVTSINWSLDRTHIVSGDENGSVQIWMAR